MSQAVISLKNIKTVFGEQVVHKDISFDIPKGIIVSLIGGSGSGKTTLLKEMIGLLRPTSGTVTLCGYDVWNSSEVELEALRKRFGLLFQQSALFSTLTAGENISVPMREQLKTPKELIDALVQLRLSFVGLDPEVAHKMPSELSGGMAKRVGLARALALEPEIVFLDEPTSGLDPISARAFDHLIRTLCDSLKLTVVMITHDLDSIVSISDRIIVLGKGTLVADGTLDEIKNVDDPWLISYFGDKLR